MHMRATFKAVTKNQDFSGFETLQGIKDYANQLHAETTWLNSFFISVSFGSNGYDHAVLFKKIDSFISKLWKRRRKIDFEWILY